MSSAHDFLAAVDIGSLWAALEAALTQINVGIVVVRVDASPPAFVFVSEQAANLLGQTAADLVGKPVWTVIPEPEQPRIRELIEKRDGSVPVLVELTIIRPDGTRIPTEAGAFRVRTPHGVLTFTYIRDLRIERAAIEALQRSEARFRYVIEAAPDGVAIVAGGKIVFVNPKAAQLLDNADPEALVGQSLGRFLPPADAASAGERIAAMFRTGEEMPPNEYGVLVDPARVVEIKSIRCEWESKPAILAFARDVTARKALAQKLVEADRLSALGRLAAGVAHEINNPLTYVQLSLQRIERTLSAVGLSDEIAHAIRDQLADAHHGLTRVATITSSLRMFARSDEAPPGPTDVVAVVERVLRMVDNDLRHRAQLVRHIEEVPSAIANASRLEQVVVNLMLNALQALPPDDASARIDVSVTSRSETVSIRVADTGHGIPTALHAQVFDPFFTTKPVGEGMGLGLAVCKSIVDGFGGELHLESAEGAGTTVTVTLRTHAAAPTITTPTRAHSPARRRVLVIDDDMLVRKVLGRILDDHHDVIVAEDGAAALALVDQTRAPFDVILCDMMMPGIDGREVHRRIAARHPGLEHRIIFITGATFGPELDKFLATVGNRCLTKPFGLDDVLSVVDDISR